MKVDPDIPASVAAVVKESMALNPVERYQTPGAMLGDLKRTLTKLEEAEPADSDGKEVKAGAAAATVAPQRTLMLVESNVPLQDIIRQKLKNTGYRVLVTADPERALARFAAGDKAADCVVFSTGELGQPALDAFNRFADGTHTAEIPAVLLLGERHTDWEKHAKLARHRVVMSMPIKLREFRGVLAKLAPLDKPVV
jgi:serine/threonine-protein kinase